GVAVVAARGPLTAGVASVTRGRFVTYPGRWPSRRGRGAETEQTGGAPVGVKLERSHGAAAPAAGRDGRWWRGRKVALVGMGVSNRALARFLVSAGAQVVGFDVKPAHELGSVASEMAALGVPLVTGPRYLEGIGDAFDAVFLSPGVDR